ncbi:hypothetical protein [Bradyrhizobium sp. RT10b]|uniref:hypothetical protein n=1 Tax=Bradyrhizobium sp. RT10b TaxID=3156331 RepID=UPI003392CD13
MTSLIQERVVYHVSTGRTVMNGIDAATAVGSHPLEWSFEEWTPEVLERAKALVARNEALNSSPPVGALRE